MKKPPDKCGDDFNDKETEEGKRNDRRLKLLERRNNEETVVKCTLSKLTSIMKSEDKALFMKEIEKRVSSTSQSHVLASLAINKILKQLFDSIELDKINNIEVPEVDQTFIRQLMLGTKGCSKKIPIIINFFEENKWFSEKINKVERLPGDSNTYSFASQKYLTCFKNHFKTNIESWIKKFIYSPRVATIVRRMKTEHGICIKNFYKYLLYNLNSWKAKKELKDLVKIKQFMPDELQDLKHSTRYFRK